MNSDTRSAEYVRKPLIVGKHPKPAEGNVVALYCDECGELECAHIDSSGRKHTDQKGVDWVSESDGDLDAKGDWVPPKSRIEERARVLRDLRANGYCFVCDERTERVSLVMDVLKVASWNKTLTWLEVAEVAVSALTQCPHLQSEFSCWICGRQRNGLDG